MTNPAAVIGLTFDGTDIQQNPIGIFLEIVRGLNEGPSVRGTDTVVPGLTGRIARNRIADRWEIELQGYVGGIDTDEDGQRADFRTLVNTIKALFDPTAMPAALVAMLEDGSEATIQARTMPTTVWDQVVPSMARISIQLEAVEDWVIVPAGS
jgi:hypothetical protein